MRAIAIALLLTSCSFGAEPDERADYVVSYHGDATALDAAGGGTVRRAASYAARTPSLQLVVAGYADDPGAPEAEQIQSRLRAQSVADALVADGVGRERIRIVPRRALGGDPAIESRRVDIRLDR